MTHIRNFDLVQHEDLRRKIDARFNTLHDSLEEAYYGERGPDDRFVQDTGWRHGVSKPWQGFDKGATPKASKALFDELHGLLWRVYELAFHEENVKQATPYPRAKYDRPTEARDGTKGTTLGDARKSLRDLRADRPTIFNGMVGAVRGEGFAIDPDAVD